MLSYKSWYTKYIKPKNTHFALVAYQGYRAVLLSVLMVPEIPDDLFAKEGDRVESGWQIILGIHLA